MGLLQRFLGGRIIGTANANFSEEQMRMTIERMVDDRLFPLLTEKLEEEGTDIGNRLLLIEALERPSVPAEVRDQYQQAANQLRKRWGLIDHEFYWASSVIHVFKKIQPRIK